ncbi:MAG TPA: class I SAM-dependent methyltransferase family protein [Candidatus Bathyarchaeia archaeon]|nr:class I SAM-dependent methyltransferase family protein [Candidatus Bathyarchaeia archaeon]
MKTLGLVTPFRDADSVLRFLNKIQLINRDLQFSRSNECLMIPLKRELSETELSELGKHSAQVRILEMNFTESPRRPKNLHEACLEQLPPNILDRLPRSYDIIGDIVLVEIEDELRAFSNVIGNGILKLCPHLRLVVRKAEKITGQFRTRNVEIIAGEGGTETIHREFECRFRLNVNSVYFNPRLSYERMRVAKQAREGEVVVDMFAGVGPYSILIAKTQPDAQVFAIDLNPVAYKYLKENALINRVAERVSCYFGDIREYTPKLCGIADRVIMNLPSLSSEFVDSAASLLKPKGGIIHYYAFARRGETIEKITRALQALLKMSDRSVESFTFQRVIKEVSPDRVQVVLDSVVR